MAHSYLGYLWLKAIITPLRVFDGEKPAPPSPDDSFTFKSQDGQREVKVNVYRPKTLINPSPVLLNWNGGAFVFDAHGADDLFCRRIVEYTSYTVLDASYALAPEYPFPSALEDAEELVLQVLAKPKEYDGQHIVLSGFSSGGNLALAAASNLRKESKISNNAIRGVAVFYPPTSIEVSPAEKKLLDGTLPPIPAPLKILMGAFRDSYLPPGVDPSDPRISVFNADPDAFPDNVLIITAEKDRLAPEAEELAWKLEKAGKKVLLKRFDGVRHGFDKAKEEGSDDAKYRDEAYELTTKFLSGLQ
ncbi:esterase lipase [Colletotrichum musicola]|uniref:Esterase lipase n=1 Tax=Colletotrichum musicola TaxID=2175873 RepID=A0A8H6NTP4_9PEZI|nr:esterase lipase [Colletotrichum musicola]